MSTTAPISHPYPPTYRPEAGEHSYNPSSIAPDESHPLYDLSQPRTSSASFASPPPNSHLHHGHTTHESTVDKMLDSSGVSEYPANWTREDEEAEREFMRKGIFDWNEMKRWQFWIRKEWWYWYIGLIILGVLVCLMAIFHDDIVDWLTPAANWMKNFSAGWVIPIVVIFVLSFPPLFGQEIVAILCGLVWGLWVGFGIVAAGTFLGEVANFIVFKYFCRHRAEKYEQKNLNYAVMAHVVREAGFFFIFVVRLSAIPGHFTTVVFSTCGMGIIVFSLACILTLPKQLIVVYLGVLFNEKEKSSKSRIISYTVLVVGFLITVAAAWYCYREMNKARVVVWRKQRMALASKGISIDPVTGEERFTKQYPNAPRDEEEELRSPLNMERQSYMNSYDIQYRPTTDGMSVYHVDGEHRPIEGDITSHAYGPSESFPQARPSAPAGLNRNPTTVSAYNLPQDPDPMPTVFPTPTPATQRQQSYDASWRG